MAGFRNLVDFLPQVPEKSVLVLGIAKDKEISQMVSLIVPFFEKVIITQGNFKPAETKVIAAEVQKYLSAEKVEEIMQVPEAIKRARELVQEKTILVTGSLYLAGDVLKNRNLFKSPSAPKEK